MTEFKAKTVNTVVPVHIKAPIEKVFPFCCPIEEYKWIPGWKFDLINCPNGKVELGTIFSEILSAPFLMGNFKGKTTWTAIVHDPDNYKLHFRLDNKNSTSLYKIELKCGGNGETIGKLDLTINAINKKGNNLLAKNIEEKIHIMLSIISAMLKHYCETGTMMTFSGLQKLVLSEQGLSITDKILIGLNRIAMLIMKDNNPIAFK